MKYRGILVTTPMLNIKKKKNPKLRYEPLPTVEIVAKSKKIHKINNVMFLK